MTSVVCFCDDCKWCADNGECNRGAITISEDYECDGYESYSDTYTDTFWKACYKNGKAYRRLAYGKKIEHNGYVFYTEDKITQYGNYLLTEERTGVNVGKFNALDERWDKFLERVATYPDVSTYPIKESEDTE